MQLKGNWKSSSLVSSPPQSPPPPPSVSYETLSSYELLIGRQDPMQMKMCSSGGCKGKDLQ